MGVGPARSRPIPESIDLSSTGSTLGSHPAPPLPARQVVVIGAGGHGRELAEIVRSAGHDNGRLNLIGIADDGNPDLARLARAEICFLGPSSVLADHEFDVFIGVGDPELRRSIDQRIVADPAPLSHPSASIGSNVRLAAGTVIAQGAILTTNISIGRHSHINIASSISHDCAIGDFCTISPGVTICGDVTIGHGVFIGAGATVLPGVTVSNGATIGAGATVIDHVSASTTVVGTPARRI